MRQKNTIFEKFERNMRKALITSEIAGVAAIVTGIGIKEKNIGMAAVGAVGMTTAFVIAQKSAANAGYEAVNNYNKAIDDYNVVVRKFNAQNKRFRDYLDADEQYNQKIAEGIVALGTAIFKTAMTESETKDNTKESDDK